jgi:hypothetical protein
MLSGTVSRTRIQVIRGDDVVEAVYVLDVERRIDVDAGCEQFLDIEVALGIAGARRIAVRQLVDQHQ